MGVAGVISEPVGADDLEETAAVFTRVRPRLFGIAYRMLSSATEAEDLVQEAWLRWQTCDRAAVVSPDAFLATTTRLAVNALRRVGRASTRNLLAAEAAAGVGHHVALSVVGTERLQRSGYFRAKAAQEKLMENSAIPYSIVHATQFFEFVRSMTDAATDGGTVRFAPVLFQPIAGDDVAQAVGRIAVGSPLNGKTEVAGPEQFRMDAFFRAALATRNDPRTVVTDQHASYFGAELGERTLLPGAEAALGEIRYDDWPGRTASGT
jgi:uncharacterized protein YbjT (DUF2867 family)